MDMAANGKHNFCILAGKCEDHPAFLGFLHELERVFLGLGLLGNITHKGGQGKQELWLQHLSESVKNAQCLILVLRERDITTMVIDMEVAMKTNQNIIPVYYEMSRTRVEILHKPEQTWRALRRLEGLYISEDPQWMDKLSAAVMSSANKEKTKRKKRDHCYSTNKDLEGIRMEQGHHVVYEQPSTSNSVSLEYPRRLTNNYMLLTDEDDARNGEEVKQVANIIHAYLDKLGYSGIQNTRDAIPGYIKSDLTRMQMCQSDFIIIVITRSSLCDKWSRVLASCMEEALTLKLEEGYNNRVIPVFLNMTEEEVKQATQPGQPLVSCYIIHEIIADPGNDIWLHKLQKIFSQTPSRSALEQRYSKQNTVTKCPLASIGRKLEVDVCWMGFHCQPKLSVVEMIKMEGSTWKQKMVSKTLDDLENLFENDIYSADVFTICSEAGMGKSASCQYLIDCWINHNVNFQRFSFLFLISPRLVKQYSQRLSSIICNELNLVPVESEFELKRIFDRGLGKDILIILDGFHEISNKENPKSNCLIDVITGRSLPEATLVITTRPIGKHEMERLISERCQVHYAVELHGFSYHQTKRYVNHAITCDEDVSDIYSNVPRYLLSCPLICALVCLLWKWKHKQSYTAILQTGFKRMTDVMEAVISVYLTNQTTDSRSTSPFKLSEVSGSIRPIFRAFTEMCLHCTQNNQYYFTTDTLQKFDLTERTVSELGFVFLAYDADGMFKSATCAHSLFQEFCCGHSIANIELARRDLFKRLQCRRTYTLSVLFGNLQRSLVFAVGLNSLILKIIAKQTYLLPLASFSLDPLTTSINTQNFLINRTPSGHRLTPCQFKSVHIKQELHLWYEALLVNECEEDTAIENFLDSFQDMNTSPPINMYGVISDHREYNFFHILVEHLSRKRSMKLLHNVYRNRLIQDRNGTILLGPKDGIFAVTDMVLLACLPFLKLRHTRSLYVIAPALPEVWLRERDCTKP